jgi:2'-5' RNA ligase
LPQWGALFKYLNIDVSNSKMNVSGLNLQNHGKGVFGNEKNENQAGCRNNSDHEQSMSSDIECFDLNRLFDMEEVVKNVKSKLKEKREDRKTRLKVCNANEQKNERTKWKEGRKSKHSDECSWKDDSDSSFGLVTLFEQANTVHKRQRKSKKGNKNVKRSKEDESYGLEWLFSEKNIGDKKNKSKSRKRKMVNYDICESEEDGRIEEIKIKKKRPNHFVAIRVSDPAIHLAIKGFQDAVLKENEKLKPALIPLLSLHITMAVMHLDETTIKIAQDALEKCKDEISRALQAVDHKLIFSGVGNFNNQIVFTKLQEKEQIDCLKTINSVVTAIFEEDGICLADKREYNPHLTLLKLSRKSSLRKNGIKKVEENVYASWLDSYFGEELVKNVHLCSMQGAKEDDGFYKCLSTITFCNDSDHSK